MHLSKVSVLLVVTLVSLSCGEAALNQRTSATTDEKAGSFSLAGSWKKMREIPRFRQEHSAVAVDDRFIYLIGGLENNIDPACEIDRYDTQENEWQPRFAVMKRCRHHFNAVVYKGEVYMAGGKTTHDNSGKKWFDKWNPKTKKWTQLRDLPEVHWGGPAVVLGRRLHVISGAKNTGKPSGLAIEKDVTKHHFSIDLQNPTAWRPETEISRAVVHAAGVALNNKIYVIGGETAHRHPKDGQLKTVFSYNPATKKWNPEPNLPVKRNHIEGSTFVHAGKIWTLSGVDSSHGYSPGKPRGQNRNYTSSNGRSWNPLLPNLPAHYLAPSAVVVANAIYVMGGWTGNWVSGFRTRDNWRIALGGGGQPPIDPPPTGELKPPTISVASTQGKAHVTWADMPVGNFYKVKRRQGSSGAFVVKGQVNKGIGKFVDSAVTVGATYQYRVVTCRQSECSKANSNTAGIKIVGSGGQPPSAGKPVTPKNLVIRRPSPTVAVFTWGRVVNADSYTVKRRKGTSGGFAVVRTINAPTLRFRDSGLQSGQKYQYRVQACNNKGCSGNSATVTWP